MSEKLTIYIDELVQNKTFSLEAVESIKQLRDKAIIIERQLNQANEDCKNLRLDIVKKDQRISEISTDISKWIVRNDELNKRESKITELEKKEAVSAAVAGVWNIAFDKVFRNTVIRESTTKSTAVPNNQGFYNTASESECKTTEKE